jgi:Fur family ferric uptake transcriptional regulator
VPAPRLQPGMRNTAQRREVYEAIGRLKVHCTAEEISGEVRRKRASFPRSTVYRALEALTASGAVYAVHLGDGPTHYELASGDHQHAVCQVCGGVLHLEHELVAELEQHLEETHRFKPARTEVLVVGICDSCARAPGKTAKRRTLEHVHFD